MVRDKHIAQIDKEYVLSGRWICAESPTGAHHWMHKPDIENDIFECRYCLELREFQLGFQYANLKEIYL